MGSGAGRAGDVIDVRLVGIPVQLHAAVQQHTDELLREFMLIASSDADQTGSVPRRLLDLVERLGGQYAATADPVHRQIDVALAEGRASVDVAYRLPRAAVDAAVELGAQLDEADEFCASGDMLTLATPPRLVAYRHWYLEEFVRQAAGQPPRSWKEYERGRHLAS